MWRQFLQWIASKLEYIVIRRDDGEVYLKRYFIRRGHDSRSTYLHHFLHSDPDEGLHNHPANLGVGLILSGGYFEDRYENEYNWLDGATHLKIVRRWLGPGRINIIRGTDFHRVILPEGKDCWTLFFRTGRNKPWGFKTIDRKFRLSEESRLRMEQGGCSPTPKN